MDRNKCLNAIAWCCLAVVVALMLAVAGNAQSIPPGSYVGLQTNWQTQSSPHVLAGAILAAPVANSETSRPTFGITELNFQQDPTAKHPGAFVTSVRLGIDQTIVTLGRFRVGGIVDAGLATNGSTTGGSWSSGFSLTYQFKKNHFFDAASFAVTADRVGPAGAFSDYHGVLWKCVAKCPAN